MVGKLKMTLPVLLFAFSFSLYASPVHAQTQNTFQESGPTWKVSEATPATLPSTISPTSPLYTDLLVNNLFHSFSCLAVGSSIIGQPCLTYQLQKDALGAIKSVPVLSQANLSGGALGATTSLIGMLYVNPPVRTADYLASLGEQFGVVKEARAQVGGSGAQVLNPILKLWQVSRNISYVIMIIIFVIIGLMVMFRQRINPQTVITAQAALPGLVIGLILITFSYFLAGLISDTAFVGTNVVGYYFAAAQGKTDDTERTNLVKHISDKNVLNIFGPLTGIVDHDEVSGFLDTIMNQLPGGVQNTLRLIVGFLVAQFFAPVAGGAAGIAGFFSLGAGLVTGPVLNLVGLAAGYIAPTFTLGWALGFVATLALIYAMIRLLLRLISGYLTIIFLTISAPFQFLAAALPGRQGITTAWILNMLGNILIFPAVLAVFYFVAFILGPGTVGTDYPLKVSDSNYIENNGFVNIASALTSGGKVTGTDTFPLFGGLDLSFINILLAFGALMALPKIPDIVVSAIGRMGQAGQLLGQEISGGVRSGQGYGQQFQGAAGATGSNLKQGIFGQRTVYYDPAQGTLSRQYTTPGLIDLAKITKEGPGKTTLPPSKTGMR